MVRAWGPPGDRVLITKKSARRTKTQSFGRPQREHHLPWDNNSLPVLLPPQQELLDFVRESAIARVADAAFCRGNGTSATAGKQSACACCIVGRQPNANSGVEVGRNTAGNMLKQNANAGSGVAKRATPGKPNDSLRSLA